MINFKRNNSIYSCMVLFNPDGDNFLISAKSILDAGSKLVIYDNSTVPSIFRERIDFLIEMHGGDFKYFESCGNIGLSVVFNIMKNYVQEQSDAEAIVFFDQDSIVLTDMLIRLITNYRVASSGNKIGVYAALAVRIDGSSYRLREINYNNLNSITNFSVKFAPSSFSLIPIETFEVVGGFHDDFFIDHIDVDFCSRCWRYGYVVLIDKTVRFQHHIGHGDIFLLGCPIFPFGAPERHYYQIRNIILSAQRGGAPWMMAIIEVIMRLAVIGVIGFKVGYFWRRYQYAFRGLRDAILKRGGSFPQRT